MPRRPFATTRSEAPVSARTAIHSAATPAADLAGRTITELELLEPTIQEEATSGALAAKLGDGEAREVIAEHRLAERCDVLFSPSFTQIAPRELADWIVADRLPMRFQLQLHKVLWGAVPGK